jgi:hypothetical protein
MQLYTVGDVQSVVYGDSLNGYGFNIIDDRLRPIASFSFETEPEARTAAGLISRAIASAQEIWPHP